MLAGWLAGKVGKVGKVGNCLFVLGTSIYLAFLEAHGSKFVRRSFDTYLDRLAR